MILRRPSQADKEAILDMMGEFEREKSVHDGGFWNTDNFIYEEWLEENLQSEAGLNIPENWVLLYSWSVSTNQVMLLVFYIFVFV